MNGVQYLELESLYKTLYAKVPPSDLIISLETSQKSSREAEQKTELHQFHRSFYTNTIWHAYRIFRPNDNEVAAYYKKVKEGTPRNITYLNVDSKDPNGIKTCLSDTIKFFIINNKALL